MSLDFPGIRARYDLARMAGTAADDGMQGWDQGKIDAMVRSWQDVSTLHDACRELIEALRLTQEYVGPDTLPPIEGWSWYDALVKYAPDLAEAARSTPTAKHRRSDTEPDQTDGR